MRWESKRAVIFVDLACLFDWRADGGISTSDASANHQLGREAATGGCGCSFAAARRRSTADDPIGCEQPHYQYHAGTSKVQDCSLVLAPRIIADSWH